MVKPPNPPVFITDGCELDELVDVLVVFCFIEVVVVVCKLLPIILEVKELKAIFGVSDVVIYLVVIPLLVIPPKVLGKKY